MGVSFFFENVIYHGSMDSQALVKYDEMSGKFRKSQKLDGSKKLQGGYQKWTMLWRGQKCSK